MLLANDPEGATIISVDHSSAEDGDRVLSSFPSRGEGKISYYDDNGSGTGTFTYTAEYDDNGETVTYDATVTITFDLV